VSIFIFILGMLAAGLVGAEEDGASQSRMSTSAKAGFHLDYGNDQMAEYAIDERIIDRLGLFDARTTAVPVITASRWIWRMKTATGVSKSLSPWNFDSNS
jgi:hypothetical protein